MDVSGPIAISIIGRYGLFTDPVMRISGEKSSMTIPTYEALRNICGNICWKPTFKWVVDCLRIMNPIRMESRGVLVPKRLFDNGSDRFFYTYLYDVHYKLLAHLEWNNGVEWIRQRPDLVADRNMEKHASMVRRCLERGGRKPVFLGTSDCGCTVAPTDFDEGQGFYDSTPEMKFSLMFHSFSYPSENGEEKLYRYMWHPVMRNGRIEFLRPEQCEKWFIKAMKPNIPARIAVS